MTTKTGEKYIRVHGDHFRVQKRINGKNKHYGCFKTLEEAITYRDFIVSKGWSTNYIHKNPLRNIYRINENRWHVSKKINGKSVYFGSFKTVEEAQKERDLLEKYDWNLDLLVEHDEGEYSYLEGKINTRIPFEMKKQRRDWY